MSDLVQCGVGVGSSLFQYISEISKFPMLSNEEELFHAKEKDIGNIESAKILVSSHLRLVVKIAGKYKNYGLPMMDLISEGNIGLMRAVKSFDYRMGYRLATYSMWWIKAHIQEFILKSWSIVKIGTSATQKKLFFNLRKIKDKLLLCSGRKNFNNGDIAMISKTLNVSGRDIVDMDNRISKGDLFLNAKIKNDEEDGTEIIDLVAAKSPLPDYLVDKKRRNKRDAEVLSNLLMILSEKEREVIAMRRLREKPLTLGEIGKKLNISGERVRQIELGALDKMKRHYNASN